MASTFKTFLNDDIATTRTLLHEAIPITGSIIYGTYGAPGAELQIKTFAHGMFQSVYDYPFLSSSANHIFDVTHAHNSVFKTQGVTGTQSTTGIYDGASQLGAIETHPFFKKRKNIYGQMGQVLVGHDVVGDIQNFDQDGDLLSLIGSKYNCLIFMNFARLLGKDEIKKGSFELKIGTEQAHSATAGVMNDNLLTIKDDGAATDYKVNSPAGEYGILKITGDSNVSGGGISTQPEYDAKCGLIFYQAGVVALTPDLFMGFVASVYNKGKITNTSGGGTDGDDAYMNGSNQNILALLNDNAKTMDDVALAFRQRIEKVCFNNTTELNSTIYFCRVSHNDFNYSSNPTYLQNSRVRVKNEQDDSPISFITSVGLYSSDNELLAVAKLSEPLRKDITNDMTLRVRLDY
tara:strand:+ start:958 stop:2172 length:1215 start_codon:yes stop_codon:yes gene_type:complete